MDENSQENKKKVVKTCEKFAKLAGAIGTQLGSDFTMILTVKEDKCACFAGMGKKLCSAEAILHILDVMIENLQSMKGNIAQLSPEDIANNVYAMGSQGEDFVNWTKECQEPEKPGPRFEFPDNLGN